MSNFPPNYGIPNYPKSWDSNGYAEPLSETKTDKKQDTSKNNFQNEPQNFNTENQNFINEQNQFYPPIIQKPSNKPIFIISGIGVVLMAVIIFGALILSTGNSDNSAKSSTTQSQNFPTDSSNDQSDPNMMAPTTPPTPPGDQSQNSGIQSLPANIDTCALPADLKDKYNPGSPILEQSQTEAIPQINGSDLQSGCVSVGKEETDGFITVFMLKSPNQDSTQNFLDNIKTNFKKLGIDFGTVTNSTINGYADQQVTIGSASQEILQVEVVNYQLIVMVESSPNSLQITQEVAKYLVSQ